MGVFYSFAFISMEIDLGRVLCDPSIRTPTEKNIKNIFLYALNTDLDVFKENDLLKFFIRKPYEGELAFDLKNNRIDELQLTSCHSILCSNDGKMKGLNEISYERMQGRTRTLFDKETTLSFFESVKPFFFDGIGLLGWEEDLKPK